MLKAGIELSVDFPEPFAAQGMWRELEQVCCKIELQHAVAQPILQFVCRAERISDFPSGCQLCENLAQLAFKIQKAALRQVGQIAVFITEELPDTYNTFTQVCQLA